MLTCKKTLEDQLSALSCLKWMSLLSVEHVKILKYAHNKDIQIVLYLKVLSITYGSEWIE